MKPPYEKQLKALLAEQARLQTSQERLTARIQKNADALRDLENAKSVEDLAALEAAKSP